MVVRVRVPGDTPAQRVTAWLSHPADGAPVDGAQRQRLKNKLLLDVTVHGLLGRGAVGRAWSATDRRGGRLVVKEVPIRSAADEAAFTHEVHMQRQLGSCGLPVIDAWIAHTLHGTSGVLCMAPVNTTLRKLVHTFQGDRPVLVMLARQLKALVRRLQRKGLVHGDLHLDNVGAVVAAGRSSVRLLTIDAANAFRTADCPLARRDVWDADVFWVYRFVLLHCPCFLPALHAVGFPGTRHVRLVSGGEVPAQGTVVSGRVAAYLDQRTRYLQQLQRQCIRKTGPRQPVGVKRPG